MTHGRVPQQAAWLTLLEGDARTVLATLPTGSVDCCVTSPPYWGLRDYRVAGQLGLEATPAEYVTSLVKVFREVWRVLRSDGTLWLNIGDCYNAYNGGAGPSSALSQRQSAARPRLASGFGLRDKALKPKDLVGIPWMVAFALRATGWYLRADIIWHKPNPMPESVTDRPTKAHEYLFLLSQSDRYYYDAEAIREPALWAEDRRAGLGHIDYSGKRQGDAGTGQRAFVSIDPAGRNKRSVWEVATVPYPDAHFATFPPDLIKPCILAGCPEGGVVLDPFVGSGTTAVVANQLGRRAIGIELSPAYLDLARKRCSQSVIWEVSGA